MKAKGVNCELRKNSVSRMWGSRTLSAPFVLHLPESSFDVAFTRHADGYLVPTCDTWGQEVMGQVGWEDFKPTPHATEVARLIAEGKDKQTADREARANILAEIELSNVGQLTQAYSNHALVNSVQSEGFTIIDQSYDAEGVIQLRYQ